MRWSAIQENQSISEVSDLKVGSEMEYPTINNQLISIKENSINTTKL
jgi:hypothetical protein